MTAHLTLHAAMPPSVLCVSAAGAHPNAGAPTGRQRLPSDPIGSFALTLTNIATGSAIRIETQAGTLIEYRVADAATEVFTIPAYSPGNANNDLRIKVRKGSGSPFYIPYETAATAFVGSSSIYVSQIPDE